MLHLTEKKNKGESTLISALPFPLSALLEDPPSTLTILVSVMPQSMQVSSKWAKMV